MPFDGTGNFVPLPLPDFPAIGGTPIYASQFNNVVNDLINGFSSVLARDGQSSMTGNLQMGGFKITNVGTPTATGDALRWGSAATLGAITVGAITSTGAFNLTGAISASSDIVSTTSVGTARTGATDATVFANVTGVGGVAIGFNNSGVPNTYASLSGNAYLGTAQNIYVDLCAGGKRAVSFNKDFWVAVLPINLGHTATSTALTGLGYNLADNFTYLGHTLGHYGITWKQLSLEPSGPMCIISGYGGIQFHTLGGPRVRIDTAGNLLVNGNLALNGGSILSGTIPWTSVTGRPTNLSQFTNDIGTGGTLTSGTLSSVDNFSSVNTAIVPTATVITKTMDPRAILCHGKVSYSISASSGTAFFQIFTYVQVDGTSQLGSVVTLPAVPTGAGSTALTYDQTISGQIPTLSTASHNFQVQSEVRMYNSAGAFNTTNVSVTRAIAMTIQQV